MIIIILKKCITILLILTILLGISYFTWGDDILINIAENYEEEGRLEDSIKFYRYTINANELNEKAHLELIRLAGLTNNKTMLEYAIQDAVDLFPAMWEVYAEGSRAFVRIEEIELAVELLNSIENSYVSQKIGKMRPELPLCYPDPGYYDKPVEVSAKSNDLMYIKDEQGKYVKYTQSIKLDFGKHIVYTVSVNASGIVSDIAKSIYTLGRDDSVVAFADKNFEEQIRAMIDKPSGDILASELWEIDSLEIENSSRITTLEDLSHFISLKYIKSGDLSNCEEIDISSLSDLKSISISGGISENVLDEILTLESLENLYLSNCKIEKLPNLLNVTSLKSIDLSGNNIQTVDFSENTTIQYMNLSYNKINKINNLQNVESLKELNLSYNNLDNLYFLYGTNDLELLNLCANKIANISPIKNINTLEHIDFSSNQIHDISSLENLTNLTKIILSDNQISDINPISKMINAEYLDISKNQIYSLPNFRGMHKLKYLSLNNNNIDDITQIAYLSNLSVLDIAENNIENLEVLQSCSNLKQINVSQNLTEIVKDVSADIKVIFD